MKLQVTQENLNKALNSVAKTASSRTTLPILSNVLLKTVKNRLSVVATNLDVAVTHFVGAKVAKEGSITVPARLTQDFINNLPAGVVELELEDKHLHINSGMYQSTINGIAAEDFPVMPQIEDSKTLAINSKLLKQAMGQTVIAASNDEARPVLTGVYFNNFNGKLYVVATDSYRLAEKALTKTSNQVNLLVPASSISDLLRIMGDNDEDISIYYDEQQVRFSVGDIELVTRLIEGKYPDYRQLIPSKFANSFTLSNSELTNVTKVSALFARESAGSITINASEEKQEISVHSIASQLGENTANAKADVRGDGSITLNSRYLLDALHATDAEKVTISFNGKLDPIVIRDASKNSDYTHLIMPLKS